MLVPLTFAAALYAPLVLLGGFWAVLIGVSLINASLGGLVAFCVPSELATIPLILAVRARIRPAAPQPGD